MSPSQVQNLTRQILLDLKLQKESSLAQCPSFQACCSGSVTPHSNLWWPTLEPKNSLAPRACGRSGCPGNRSIHFGVIFLSLKNSTYHSRTALWSGLVQSKKSDSFPSFCHNICVPFCPNWQCLCCYNPIFIPGFCWDRWFDHGEPLSGMPIQPHPWCSLQNKLLHFVQ